MCGWQGQPWGHRDTPHLCSASNGLHRSYERSRHATLINDNVWQVTGEPAVPEGCALRSDFHLGRRPCREAVIMGTGKAEHRF